MRKENQQEFDIVNLTEWHKAGYKGKGIKVMSFENLTKGHGKLTLDVFTEIAPEAEIFEPEIEYSKNGDKCFSEGIQQAIDNGVDLIFNALHFTLDEEKKEAIQKAHDAGIIILNAIGNQGEERIDKSDNKYTDVRNFNNFTQVGAVAPRRSGGIYKLSYSNTGKILSRVAFTNTYTADGTKFTGTSSATPFEAGVDVCLIGYMKEHEIPKSKFNEILEDNMMDLGVEGRDDKYGEGMFVLPKLYEMDKYKGSDNMSQIINYAEDNIPKSTPYNRRPATKRIVKGICIHNTANPTSTALNERSWLTNTDNLATASYNYVIDAYNIIQCIPDDEVTWHATDGSNGEGNVNYLSIEICESGNYVKNEKAAKHFIVSKLIKYGLTPNDIKPHKYFYSEKDCPRLILPYWDQFIDEITEMYNEQTQPKEEVSEWAKESWQKAIDKDVNDGIGAKNNITEEQLMVFFDRLGLLD